MTAILPAVPSLVPRLIWGLADHSDHLLAGYQIAEALYYATLHMRPSSERGSQTYKLHSKILAHTRLAQTTFQIADGITVFLCARKVIEQIHKRFPSFASYSAMRWQKIAWTGASAALVCTLAIGLLQTIHRFLPSETTEGETDNLTYTATMGFNAQQFSLQVPPMARILLEVALSCLSRNPFWSACSALASTTTLINSLRIRQLSVTAALKDEVQKKIERDAIDRSKMSKAIQSPFSDWLRDSRSPEDSWPDPLYTYIARATVTTTLLYRAHTVEFCPGCLDESDNAQRAELCSNTHPLHIACLSTQLAISIQTLMEKRRVFIEKVTVIDTGSIPFATTEYYRHRVEVNQSDLHQLFHCSQCRAPTLFEPVIENVLIHCDHRGRRDIELAYSVTIADPSRASFFSYLCTAYNVTQAALATLYRYPELGESLWSIQKLSLAFDLVEFSHTLYILHQKMKAKIYGTEERKLKFSLVYIAGAASLVALSCLAVKGMGRFLYPDALLKELISTSNPLDIRWDAPPIYFAIQSLAVSRALASLALSFCSSSQARQNRFIALAQLCTTVSLSQLRWIRVTQTLDNPFTYATSTERGVASPLETDCVFMIPYSCASQLEHLRSVVHAISDYTRQMFDESHWKIKWSYVTEPDGYLSERIYLEVQLKSRTLASCACTLFPKMTDITMKAFLEISKYCSFTKLWFPTVSRWVEVSVIATSPLTT